MGREEVRADTAEAAPAFSYTRIFWIGMGFLGIMVALVTYDAFVPLLLREFIDSRAAIGAIMGLDNLIGLLLIPVIGAWSDRIEGRLGRRLPFILVGLPIAALSFALIPIAAFSLPTLIITSIVFATAIQGYRGPVVSLMPDHTPPPKRPAANGIVNLLGGIGGLIALGGLSWLYDIDPRLTFGAGAMIMLLTLLIVWRASLRAPPYVGHDTPAHTQALRTALAAFTGLLRHGQRGTRRILLGMLVYYIGFAGIDALFPIYAVETLGLSEGRAAFLLSAFALAFVAFAVFAGIVGNRYGALPSILVALAVMPLVLLSAVPVTDPRVLAGILVLAGMTWAVVNVQAVPIVANLGGSTRIGLLVGLYFTFTMLGQMIGPALIGGFMDLFGNRGLFVGGAIAYAAGFILILRGRRALKEDGAMPAAGVEADRVADPPPPTPL